MSKTLSLNTRQWRVLLNDNLDVLKAAVQSVETLNEEGLKAFHEQLDNMRMLSSAWFQVGVPPAEAAVQPNPMANGAAAPKRRGRRTNAEKAAMAQQAQVQ